MQNPFKSLSKDGPARARDDRPIRGGTFNSGPRSEPSYGMNNQGFRGGRGGGFNRGGYNAHNNQYNRNFSGPMGGYNNNNNTMGFQGNMGGMGNNYGGFNRGGMMGNPMRGNMGGMRGGRGGMNNMMPMSGGMGMGNMGMNPMMAGMGMTGKSLDENDYPAADERVLILILRPGFQGNQFNPGMFNSMQGPNFGGGGGSDWNQHGVKRQRQE